MTNRENLDAILNRQPFRFFRIELASGRMINVTKDAEVFSPRAHPSWIYVFGEDGSVDYFELEQITALVEYT
jgi:hypothetical protein